MIKRYFSNRTKRFQYVSAVLVILVVAGIGTYLLISSHAATPYIATTADTGTLSGGATKQACSGSSDGSCVAFKASATGTDSNKGVPWVGLDGYMGWGPSLTSYFYADGFRWARESAMQGAYQAGTQIDSDLSAGLNVIIILPTNTSDAMSWMNAYKGDGSRVMYEFWNEPWTSSNGTPAIPVATYTQEYEAAYNAKKAAGITQPLLYMTTGDQDGNSSGSTWLAEAVKSDPGLQVDAFSTHPYGQANQIDNTHTYGVNALLYLHQEAVSLGFTATPWYVTEFGFTIDPSQSGDGAYASSYAQQASDLTASYNQMIAYGDGTSGTWLQGIMYYQAHDDSTGWWGLITAPATTGTDAAGEPAGVVSDSSPTPINPRPAYTALKAFLTNH